MSCTCLTRSSGLVGAGMWRETNPDCLLHGHPVGHRAPCEVRPVIDFAKLSEVKHPELDDSLRRDIERAAASRLAAREAEMQRLTIGILSGAEGTDRAALVYDEHGVPHGVYGAGDVPYTITEQLPLYGFNRPAGFALGELPRVVHTIPRRWVLELLNGDTLPISQQYAAVLIEDEAIAFGFHLDGVAHVTATTELSPGATYVCGRCPGRTWPTARRLSAHVLAEHPVADDPQTTDADAPAQREEH